MALDRRQEPKHNLLQIGWSGDLTVSTPWAEPGGPPQRGPRFFSFELIHDLRSSDDPVRLYIASEDKIGPDMRRGFLAPHPLNPPELEKLPAN